MIDKDMSSYLLLIPKKEKKLWYRIATELRESSLRALIIRSVNRYIDMQIEMGKLSKDLIECIKTNRTS